MSIIPKLRKDFHKLSQIEQKKERDRVREETLALIDEMGQEDEKKALDTVRKYVAQMEQDQREEFYQDFEALKKKSNNKMEYQRYLLLILHRYVREEEIPKKYILTAESTDEGIVLGLEGTEYVSAFKVCGVPEYDIRACKVLATKLGNTVSRLEGNFTKTEGGIITASEGEAKIAMRQFDKKNGRPSS